MGVRMGRQSTVTIAVKNIKVTTPRCGYRLCPSPTWGHEYDWSREWWLSAARYERGGMRYYRRVGHGTRRVWMRWQVVGELRKKKRVEAA